MAHLRQFTDAAQRYLGELAARIVANSGRPSDRHHLGKIILQSLKDAPDFVLQINGATDQSETCGSVLKRSIKCSMALRNFGLDVGDVIVIMAPNHLDLTVPYYASLFNGLTLSCIDMTLAVKELEETFSISRPRVIFCQSERLEDVQLAIKGIKLDATVVTFDDSPNSFAKFNEKYGSNASIEDFRAADFDPTETLSFLVTTSGSTGVPKCAAVTHSNVISYLPYMISIMDTYPEPTRSMLMVSPIQWISAQCVYLISAVFRTTRIQTPEETTTEHVYHLINKYKPTYSILSSTFITTLLKDKNRAQCDFSCFEVIAVGGSAITTDIIDEFRAVAPNTALMFAYGMSEIGVSHADMYGKGQDYISFRSHGHVLSRLVDLDTGKDIVEPNVTGELWMKGPSVFKGYYKNPEVTKDTFSEDGWLKSGDLFYRDKGHSYIFVDRIKMLLKYRNHQISPVEIEAVIRQHPAVSDVAVAGIPDPECGDLPVACVVRRHGFHVTADEIKKLVKDSLTDSKQLRGGVAFVTSLPLTPTSKVNRKKLKEIVCELETE